MPITYTLDHGRRRMNTRARGLVTLAEVEAHLDMEQADRALGYVELFDARGATTDMRAGDIRTLVERAREVLEREGSIGPTAVVADNDALYGMARMYEMTAEFVKAPVHVFRELKPALAWLDAKERERDATPGEPTAAR